MKKKSKTTPKKPKTPRMEKRPRTAPTEFESWAEQDDVEYITFNSVKEFQDYVRAIGESLEIDPEGRH